MQEFDNTYSRLLREQGNYVVAIDDIDWYEYQGFMIPAYLPHCVPSISKEIALKVLKKTKKPFVRWDSNFGKLEKSEWWYILKKGTWDVESVPDKKKRWMIKQGRKNFAVRPLTCQEVIESCHKVAHASTARYKGSKKVEDVNVLQKRIDAGLKVPGVLEYIGCFKDNQLVSYSENYIQDNAVWLAIIRHDPEYLDKYSGYGLMDGILEYYLNEKKFDYVIDGSRSMHHKTQFQEHLIKVFGFTKEYATLNMVYSPAFKIAVNTAYYFKDCFWWLSGKTESNFIANISAVLKQEYIRRSCQQII